jgi:Fe2+ or Zn2+ uptake regulation protein
LASTSDDGLSVRFRQTGLRLTAARRAVIALLEDSQAEHLSAKEIHGALSAEGVTANLSSVYRILKLLVALGLVHRIDLSESHAHFGVEREKQVHLRCEVCGEVSEVYLPGHIGLVQRLQGLARKRGFELTRFRVEAEGKCKRCAFREKQHQEE